MSLRTALVTPRTDAALDLLETLAESAKRMIAATERSIRWARTRKLLCSLSDEQLLDLGIDRSFIQSGPAAEVDARLMMNLMSLR
jgi:uncharacterized protein YjiS (DUF1127 family)